MDDQGRDILMKLAGAIWLVMFGALLTFIMGVVVWAVAGPALAILIFAAAVGLFVWLPLAGRRRNAKSAPPPGA